MAGEEIIYVFRWFVLATSMFLLFYFLYEIVRGSRAGLYRYLIPLAAILINYEEFFLAEFFFGQELHFLKLIAAMSRESLLEIIIGTKVLTILLTLFCFLFHRFKFVNKYLDIFILSILISYGTITYGFTISTGNYVPGLISSTVFVLPIWLLAVKYSLKRFQSISSLSIIIILGFLFNTLYFFEATSLLPI